MQILDFMRRKSAAGDSPAPSTIEFLKTNVRGLDKLPTLPEAALKAMAVAKEPDCVLSKLAAVIERDPALSTGILKLANSALYRVGRSIASLDQALLRLGLWECQNLIITVGMRSLFRHGSFAKRAACKELWRHSFLTACLCRRLNCSLGLGFNGEEFSCGIAHDIGRVLIALWVPESFDAADPLDFREGLDILDREQQILGTDHCTFGGWFANVNQLPSALASAIQFHHQPGVAGEYRSLVSLVAAADDMANFVQRIENIPDYDPADNPAWPVLEETWPADKLTTLQEVAGEVITHAVGEAEEVGTLTAA